MENWQIIFLCFLPISILVAVIIVARKNRRVDPPSLSSYDYIVVGGAHAGCVAATRLAQRHPMSTILLLERQTGGQAFCGGWGNYQRPGLSSPSCPLLVTFFGSGGREGGLNGCLAAVERMYPCLTTPLIPSSLSPLTWASGFPPVCLLPRLDMIHALPTNVELREGVQVVDVKEDDVKLLVRGRNNPMSVSAKTAILLCVGSKNVHNLVPTSYECRDIIAVPLSFQAKPNLRLPTRVPVACEGLRVLSEQHGTTLRFMPESTLTAGKFEHAFSIVATTPITQGAPEFLKEGVRKVRTLVQSDTAKLLHLATGKEFIDVLSIQSVARPVANAVIFESTHKAGRRSANDLAIRKISDEIQTDEYIQRYVDRNRMKGGEPHGACPMGHVVDAEKSCLLIGSKKTYVADASVVPVDVSFFYGASGFAMAVAFCVADQL